MNAAKKPLLYLVGAYTDDSAAAYTTAAMLLRGAGYPVLTPVDLGASWDADASRGALVRRLVEGLMMTDEVILLPGWENDTGKMLDTLTARMDIPARHYQTLMKSIMGIG